MLAQVVGMIEAVGLTVGIDRDLGEGGLSQNLFGGLNGWIWFCGRAPTWTASVRSVRAAT